jgi:hypothetical protein
VADWDAGFTDDNVGGLLNAMLSPVGGFRKVLTVLLSFLTQVHNNCMLGISYLLYSTTLGNMMKITKKVNRTGGKDKGSSIHRLP